MLLGYFSHSVCVLCSQASTTAAAFGNYTTYKALQMIKNRAKAKQQNITDLGEIIITNFNFDRLVSISFIISERNKLT